MVTLVRHCQTNLFRPFQPFTQCSGVSIYYIQTQAQYSNWRHLTLFPYIDLSLADVPQGVDALERALRKHVVMPVTDLIVWGIFYC